LSTGILYQVIPVPVLTQIDNFTHIPTAFYIFPCLNKLKTTLLPLFLLLLAKKDSVTTKKFPFYDFFPSTFLEN
jgi:hypothetical protein